MPGIVYYAVVRRAMSWRFAALTRGRQLRHRCKEQDGAWPKSQCIHFRCKSQCIHFCCMLAGSCFTFSLSQAHYAPPQGLVILPGPLEHNSFGFARTIKQEPRRRDLAGTMETSGLR